MNTQQKRDSFQAAPGPFFSDPSQNFVETLSPGSEERFHEGKSIYRGNTTGVEIVGSLRSLCDTFTGFQPNFDHPASTIVNALDSQGPWESLSKVSGSSSFLSLGADARKWIDKAFDESFILWPFVDREMFDARVQRLLEYGSANEDYRDKDLEGLLHSIIALGQRHDSSMITPQGDRSLSFETRGCVYAIGMEVAMFLVTNRKSNASFRHFAAAR